MKPSFVVRFSLVIALFVGAQLQSVAQTNCSAVPANLVTWWAGDGNTIDEWGYLNGEIHGGTTFTPGMVGAAFSFNGINSCVTNVMPGLTNIIDNYTTEFWAQPTAARDSTGEGTLGVSGSGGQRYAIFPAHLPAPGIVGTGVSVGTNGVSVFEHGPGHLPALLVYNGAITGWTHIAVVFTNRQPRLYLNGVLARTGLTSQNPNCPSTWLGERGAGSVNQGFYAGLLDEVTIYGRPLSQPEIAVIYAAGAAGKCRIEAPPMIVKQPTNQIAYIGGSAEMLVNASGTPVLQYQWQHQGTNLAGATSALLALTNLQPPQAGSYAVVITNNFGAVTSVTALLTLQNPPACSLPSGIVTWWTGDGDSTDKMAYLNGAIHGGTTFAPGKVGYAFSFNGVNSCVTNGTPGLTQIINHYTTEFWAKPTAARAVTSQDTSGVSNWVGQRYAIFPAHLPAPGIVGTGISVGTNGVSVFEHGPGHLPSLLVYNGAITGWTHIAVVFTNRQPLLYLNGVFVHAGLTSLNNSCPSTWLGERGALNVNQGFYAGLLDEVSIYNRSLAPAEIEAIYNLGALGKCRADEPPVITTQPTNRLAFFGATAEMLTLASGSPILQYQWQHEGTNLPGATSALLTLTNLQPNQAGVYAAVITNVSGSVTSINATLTLQAAPSCVMPSGLVSWWKAQNAATDAFGTNHGTLFNGTHYADGKVGLAFEFDGVNNHVRIEDAPGLRFTNAMTVEAWVFAQDGDYRGIVAKWGAVFGENKRAYSFALLPDNSYSLALSGNGQAGPLYAAVGVTLVPQNQWTHLAGTYDGAKIRVYINGAFDGELDYAGGIFPSDTELGIGGVVGGAPPGQLLSPFVGKIDEVSLYNRALSGAEIQAIYNSGISGKCCDIPVTIVTQPLSQVRRVGGRVTLSVAATGCEVSYQWRFGTNNIIGATSPTFAITNFQAFDAGTYSVVLSNQNELIISAAAVLTVDDSCLAAPQGLVALWPGEGNAKDPINWNDGTVRGNLLYTNGIVGEAFTFRNPNTLISIPTAPFLNLSSEAGFTIEGWVNPSNALNGTLWEWSSGDLGVQVGLSSAGSISISRSIAVNLRDTSGISHPFSTAANVMTNGVFQHVAVVYTRSNGTAQIYRNGLLLTNRNVGNFVPQTGYPLHLGGRPSGEAAVTGAFGGAMDEIALYERALTAVEVQDVFNAGAAGRTCVAPEFVTHPANIVSRPFSNVTFTASVKGSLPLRFQWWYEGNEIPGATNLTLTISNVQPSRAGNYSVQVTNQYGSAISSNAQLKVPVVFALADGKLITNAVHEFAVSTLISLTNVYASGPIFYTLDGATPSVLSAPYVGPFVVSGNAVLRAIGYRADLVESGQLDPIQLIKLPVYSLTVSTPGGGTVLRNPPSPYYLANSSVTITASPDPGWAFLHWRGDASGTNPVTTVKMTRHQSVQAIFITSLEFSVVGSGGFALNPPGGVYPYGSVVQISAVPEPGNYFGLWGNSASGNANPLNFVVTNADATIAGLFAEVPNGQVALTVLPLGRGQVSVSPQANVYPVGAHVTIAATPASGQSFLHWDVYASDTQNPLPLTLETNTYIVANFTQWPQLRVLNPDGIRTDGVSLLVSGIVGERHRLESSTNLIVWVPLAELTNTFGEMTYLDVSATNAANTYYRLMTP